MKRQLIEKKEELADTLRISKDISLGATCVALTGKYEAWVEHYKGILEYTDSQILLQGRDGMLCVEGCRLTIEYYTNENMKIKGCIKAVRFL